MMLSMPSTSSSAVSASAIQVCGEASSSSSTIPAAAMPLTVWHAKRPAGAARCPQGSLSHHAVFPVPARLGAHLAGGLSSAPASRCSCRHRRLAGMSSVFSSSWSFVSTRAAFQQPRWLSRAWRLQLALGLVLGAALWWITVGPTGCTTVLAWRLALSGLVAGFRQRLAGGCTSGHGICGIGSLKLPSLLAVLDLHGHRLRHRAGPGDAGSGAMSAAIATVIAGALFGFGLALSGMIRPGGARLPAMAGLRADAGDGSAASRSRSSPTSSRRAGVARRC